MRTIKRGVLLLLLSAMLAGCSSDIREISDIALVMLTAIDYDEQKQLYVFTVNCLEASTNTAGNTARKPEWIASASGPSVFEAARNLRSRAGKVLIWQHDKFFLIGESAARRSFYEVVDFLTRSRDIRLSSFLIVAQGNASELMRTRAETGDLLSNEMLGKVKNEQLWGKSLTLAVKDIVNEYTNPYRGIVTGKLSKAKPMGGNREVLFLSGGSVIQQGRLKEWLSGDDTLSIHILVNKKYWKALEFAEYVPFNDRRVALRMRVGKRSMSLVRAEGKPGIAIRIEMSGSITSIDKKLNLADPATLHGVEEAASRYMEQRLKVSLNRFQRELKSDIIGFSDYLRQHHPYEWKRISKTWVTDVYPTMPIRVRVDVAIPTIGMSEVIGGP
ncbi:Ger(x)C family spore germination protein [Paenibacillus sacheonensis]|uniref:Ger(X)C family spore germination protein n=1 Tax=Paenibacillus sacheonensis TaxID=742054 RepID=A0A7X5C2L3_9BACL|nr:Ger(x)C family spore germination protein [Paenibacillus sacheonensis]MBM7566299.1 Ger(x)C family germination protein [Paenibacillus sacheonensis]NBC70504.1 Ger(x)C family spore germination protein [Paenibacillus sacheonensis]